VNEVDKRKLPARWTLLEFVVSFMRFAQIVPMRFALSAWLPLLLPHAERHAAPLLCDRLNSALGAMPTSQTYNTVLISRLSAADAAERR
jgi:hypothetical protein